MYKIPLKDWYGSHLSYYSCDDQISVDHYNCPAGRDTRQRLYIKKVGHDSYVCHCFNCGGSGYYFGSSVKRVEDLHGVREKADKQVRTASKVYSDATDDLPLHVEKYLLDYHVTKQEAVKILKYRWHKDMDGLCMPMYQDRRNLFTLDRLQVRNMPSTSASRYRWFGNHDHMFGLVAGPSHNKNIVLVEDQISAYRVFRDSSFKIDAMALMGTHIPTSAIECLKARGHDKVCVWMDADVAGATAAREISTTLAPILGSHKVHHVTHRQAKDMSKPYLEGFLSPLIWTT